ncbi:MAG: GGDEF domain-containing protein [Flexistipes sinusarabici]|uniref:diguanylate cyclase n=1 Tax=Flexistipes sinusarabici TaxID=2352 RepID=A0A5D0ML92_FLESI|nr:GGDEF domain-containing protein [Flexistipes sinusarabici]TYB32695.1 MAG: GGDEF domain-containing protein [Flexistipes sinusarabici]
MNKTFLLCFHDKKYLQKFLKDLSCDYALNNYEAYSKLIAKEYNAVFISEEFLLNNKFFISVFVKEICSSKPPLIVISENYYFLPDLISVPESDLPKVLSSFTEEFLEPVRHNESDVFQNLIAHMEELFLNKYFYDMILKGLESLDQCFLKIIEVVDVVLLPELFVIGRVTKGKTEYFVSLNNRLSNDIIKKILAGYKLAKGKLILRNEFNIKGKHTDISDLDFFVKKNILTDETIFTVIGIKKSDASGNNKKLANSLQNRIKATVFYMSSLLKRQRMYITDYLTGVYNRRFFDETVKKELHRSKRHRKGFVVIFFDIDNFKDINDKYGHSAGDHILTSLTSHIQTLIRDSDIFARLGGEEFGILLPETEADGGQLLAEKIRREVAVKTFTFESSKINLTISAGVLAVKNFEDADYDRIYKMSDDAMYEAKRLGKNGLVVSEI